MREREKIIVTKEVKKALKRGAILFFSIAWIGAAIVLFWIVPMKENILLPALAVVVWYFAFVTITMSYQVKINEANPKEKTYTKMEVLSMFFPPDFKEEQSEIDRRNKMIDELIKPDKPIEIEKPLFFSLFYHPKNERGYGKK